MTNIFHFFLVAALFFIFSTPGFATQLSTFADDPSWILMADDDGFQPNNGFVDPGFGGQDFDAEYLFYKFDGVSLSIALQTGFDLSDGMQNYPNPGSKAYYAGDLAISFDGLGNGYEYAFDMGFLAIGYDGENTGTHEAGFYSVTSWSNDVYDSYTESIPFAMKSGSELENVGTLGSSIYDSSLDSYARIMTIDLATLDSLDQNFSLSDFSGFYAHWTMSCGNDAINGYAPVPEPSTFALLGIGGAMLFYVRRKK